MDVSQIEEKRALQAILVAKVQGALDQARKNVEIVEKELSAAVKTAETRLQIAHLRLEKFIGQPIDSAEGDSSGTNAAMVAGLRELLSEESSKSDSDTRRPGIVEKVLEILGPEGMLWGDDAVARGAIQEAAVFSPGPAIYGGTDEIQRNILGERVLGLPKEPKPASA